MWDTYACTSGNGGHLWFTTYPRCQLRVHHSILCRVGGPHKCGCSLWNFVDIWCRSWHIALFHSHLRQWRLSFIHQLPRCLSVLTNSGVLTDLGNVGCNCNPLNSVAILYNRLDVSTCDLAGAMLDLSLPVTSISTDWITHIITVLCVSDWTIRTWQVAARRPTDGNKKLPKIVKNWIVQPALFWNLYLSILRVGTRYLYAVFTIKHVSMHHLVRNT